MRHRLQKDLWRHSTMMRKSTLTLRMTTTMISITWTTPAAGVPVLPAPRCLHRAHRATVANIIAWHPFGRWNTATWFWIETDDFGKFLNFKLCKRNDLLDRVLPSVDVVRCQHFMDLGIGFSFNAFIFVSCYCNDLCFMYKVASLCGCQCIFILWSATNYIKTLWISFCNTLFTDKILSPIDRIVSYRLDMINISFNISLNQFWYRVWSRIDIMKCFLPYLIVFIPWYKF